MDGGDAGCTVCTFRKEEYCSGPGEGQAGEVMTEPSLKSRRKTPNGRGKQKVAWATERSERIRQQDCGRT